MNGELIRRVREAKGLSQRDLATLAGVPQPSISLLETGARQSVSIPTLKRLAAVLGVSTDDLLTEAPEEALAQAS